MVDCDRKDQHDDEHDDGYAGGNRAGFASDVVQIDAERLVVAPCEDVDQYEVSEQNARTQQKGREDPLIYGRNHDGEVGVQLAGSEHLRRFQYRQHVYRFKCILQPLIHIRTHTDTICHNQQKDPIGKETSAVCVDADECNGKDDPLDSVRNFGGQVEKHVRLRKIDLGCIEREQHDDEHQKGRYDSDQNGSP